MLKKQFILVMLMLLAIANVDASTWKMHNFYLASRIENVYDVGDKVYYLNSGSLYMFEKATQQTTALSKQNILSDNGIRQLYYDYENKLLFVAYKNSNIDVIDAEGKVTNISNIKDAIVRVHNFTLTTPSETDPGYNLATYSTKTINDINFGDGIAYVAIGYGYVTIDESTLRIIDSFELGQKLNINSVAIMGDQMLVMSNSYIYYGPKTEGDPMHNYSRRSGSYTGFKFYPIDDHSVFVLGTSKLYRLDFSTATPTLTTLVSAGPTSVQKTPTGFIANFADQNYYYTIDPTGTTATKASSVAGFASADPLGDGTVWINDGNGLHQQGSSTNYKMNMMTISVPYWLKYNATMNVLYAGSSAPNHILVNTLYTNVVNTYDGLNWSVVTPYTTSNSVGYEFVFNPLDSTTYFRATWKQGIYKVTNNQMISHYTSTNAPIGTYKAHPAFDNYGNMWVVSSFNNPTCPVAVLPQRYVSRETPVKADWFQPSGFLSLNTGAMQRSRFVVARKNNAKIYSDCDYFNPRNKQGYIFAWDNDNTDVTVDNYHLSLVSHFVDQDNKLIDWIYLVHMEQDNEGLMWVGTTTGLFIFDPANIFDDVPKAVRPLVTKSIDGTKGYLCDGYSVNDIGVDRDNNKWLATNDGVYHVSADGSEVYSHFTTMNSDLPGDIVYSVECDTVNDRIYVYTENGFAEYMPNGSAAALNFDNVYAFPNPIEPDFTGLVKIANLMDNTYLTITDRDGNVVAEMGPVMGSALWDGSGADGERLPTGIYNIYAAQGAQPATTGKPVTTVMIIK